MRWLEPSVVLIFSLITGTLRWRCESSPCFRNSRMARPWAPPALRESSQVRLNSGEPKKRRGRGTQPCGIPEEGADTPGGPTRALHLHESETIKTGSRWKQRSNRGPLGVVRGLTFLSPPQGGTPGEGRHHQHQRRADRLGQRRQRRHPGGRRPADGGEARQRGRDPHHRPRGDRTLTPHPTGRATDTSAVNPTSSWLSLFFYQLLTLQNKINQ